jgi:hypothetical protein
MNETSLSRLHDIVVPPAVPFWPPAPGWYIVGGLLLMIVVAASACLLRRWRRNAYRREALGALRNLDEPEGISPLLKRTALAAWPREQVASLSGEQWHRFLADSVGQPTEARGWAASMERVSFDRDARLSPGEREALWAFAELWICRHRVEAG